MIGYSSLLWVHYGTFYRHADYSVYLHLLHYSAYHSSIIAHYLTRRRIHTFIQCMYITCNQ